MDGYRLVCMNDSEHGSVERGQCAYTHEKGERRRRTNTKAIGGKAKKKTEHNKGRLAFVVVVVVVVGSMLLFLRLVGPAVQRLTVSSTSSFCSFFSCFSCCLRSKSLCSRPCTKSHTLTQTQQMRAAPGWSNLQTEPTRLLFSPLSSAIIPPRCFYLSPRSHFQNP